MVTFATGSYSPTPPSEDYTALTGVPDWYARIAAGDFYIGDRHHYLFGEKDTYTLNECKRTSFTLADFPVSTGSTSVTVEGHPYSDFMISGQKFSLLHADPMILAAMWEHTAWDADRLGWYKCGYSFDPNAFVEVTYDYLTVGAGTGTIATGTIMQRFNLRDGYDEHYLPTGYYQPIIFTDDCIQPANARDFVPEYSLDPATRALHFNAADNRLLNPAFDCIPYESGCPLGSGYFPLGWEATSNNSIGLLRVPDAYYGKNVILAQGTGYCVQEVDIDPRLPYSVSAWVRGREGVTGEACLSINYVDASGFFVDPSGVHVGSTPDWSQDTVMANMIPGSDWRRLYLTLGDPTSLYPNMTAALPPNAETLQVKLYSCGTGQVEFDAIQVEVGYTPTQFGFVSPASTLEVESDPTGIYQYNSVRQAPFEHDKVDLNGGRTEIVRGFMSIGEYCTDWHNEPVGKGGPEVLPIPTGEFVVYRGALYDPLLIDYPVLIAEGPKGYEPHYLQSYSPDGQVVYALLDVGRTSSPMYEYSNNFITPDGVTYPNGIASEAWVGTQDIINLKYGGGSGTDAWADVLKWRLRDILLQGGGCSGAHQFNGIMYYNVNDGTGVYPFTEIPPQQEEMASLIQNVHTWAEGLYGSSLLAGISNGTDVIRREITNASWALNNLDSLMIDGLTITRAADINTNLDRNLIRTKVLHTMDGAADYFNLNFPIYALDYMDLQPTGFITDIVDEVLITESMYYAHGECWRYYCGPTGLCDVLSLTGYLYNFGIATEDNVPPCTGLGRMHTSWGKMSGYNKLRKRSTFHLENEPFNDDATSPGNAAIPKDIVLLTTNSVYEDTDGTPHVSLTCTGILSVQTVVKDTFRNNVDEERVYATALYGSFDAPWRYTDHSGAAEFKYILPVASGTGYLGCTGINYTGVDLLSFVTRSPDIYQHMYVDRVGCITGEVGDFNA